MSNKCDWLGELQKLDDHQYAYDLENIKEKHEVRELCRDGWIVLKKESEDEYGCWLKFAVLEFFQSETNGVNIKTSLVFHGEGLTGLREPRHFYFGENGDGYLFYPNVTVITTAFEALKEFFDFD